MKSLLLMVQMFTRIPLRELPNVTMADYRRGILYLPLIGGCIGLLFFAIARLTQMVFSIEIASLLLVISWAMITGGIHLDGLADTADGFFSNREPERVLEIMKDSLIGSFGVIALILVLGAKYLLIRELLLAEAGWLLVLPPLFSRFALVVLSWRGHYARASGMGALFIGKITMGQLIGSALWLIPALLVFPVLSLFSLAFLLVYTYYYRRVCARKIGGLTGDTLGAHVEVTEVIGLLLLDLMV